ncbi:MAG TPA: 2,3-diketo-5-methylthiopentyl-1-phosphate enolase [Calditerricola sp.]
MTNEWVVATYQVPDDGDLRKKAESIAVGLTVGTWTDLPAARRAELEPYKGVVVDIRRGQVAADGSPVAHLAIGYPVCNLRADIPSLLTTVFGKLSMDGRIRLVDLKLPDAFVRAFPGPRLGIAGVRRRLGVWGRPLLMSIFKSCIGLSLAELHAQFVAQVEGGVDLVKDDEIFFVDDRAPVFDRIALFREALDAHEAKTGRRVLYAVNLTGPVDELVDRAREAVRQGATALLLNVLPYGYDILQRLREDSEITVPVLAHPALAGALYASPHHGIAAPIVLGTLMRLAGADLVLFPSPYGTVPLDEAEAFALRDRLVAPFAGLAPAFPVPSAGIHPGMVPRLLADFGLDHVVNAGGGIHGHPDGPRGGGEAFVAAIEAAVAGVPLEERAKTCPALDKALAKWGVLA